MVVLTTFPLSIDPITVTLFTAVLALIGSLIVTMLNATVLEKSRQNIALEKAATLEKKRQRATREIEKKALREALYSEIIAKLREAGQSAAIGDLSRANDRVALERALSSFKTCPVYKSAITKPEFFYQLDDARGIEYFYQTLFELPTTCNSIFRAFEALFKHPDRQLITAMSEIAWNKETGWDKKPAWDNTPVGDFIETMIRIIPTGLPFDYLNFSLNLGFFEEFCELRDELGDKEYAEKFEKIKERVAAEIIASIIKGGWLKSLLNISVLLLDTDTLKQLKDVTNKEDIAEQAEERGQIIDDLCFYGTDTTEEEEEEQEGEEEDRS